MLFCRLLIFFSKLVFSKNTSRNTTWVSNSSDPDLAQQHVGPDLGPNCLQRFSADVTSRQWGKFYKISFHHILSIFIETFCKQEHLLQSNLWVLPLLVYVLWVIWRLCMFFSWFKKNEVEILMKIVRFEQIGVYCVALNFCGLLMRNTEASSMMWALRGSLYWSQALHNKDKDSTWTTSGHERSHCWTHLSICMGESKEF